MIEANNEHQNKNQLSMSLSDNTLVLQYKDLIREQDVQIQKLNQANDILLKEKQELEVPNQYLFFLMYIYIYKINMYFLTIIDTTTRTSIDC